MYEPYVILWDNTNPQAITVAFWLFTLSKIPGTRIIIVSVLNEVEWLVCLFYSKALPHRPKKGVRYDVSLLRFSPQLSSLTSCLLFSNPVVGFAIIYC